MRSPPADAPAAPEAGRPPAVLQVLPRLVAGGVERGTVEIAQALAAAGWTSLVASAGGPMEYEIAKAGGRHITLPLHSKNPLVMRRNVKRLVDVIRRFDVDIVHARSRAPAWSARAAAARAGVHFVTTFHNVYGDGNRLRRWYNSVMAGGERVIAISEFVGMAARTVYGVDSDRLRVIPRGVDLVKFDSQRVSAERLIQLAKAWRLPDDAQVVMLPGRLTRWKGQLDLIEAVTRLDTTRLRVLLVGSDDGREGFRREVEKMIAARGLSGVFQIADHCNDMPAAYMLANVVVSASNRPEGFGRVVVEAQAMGRPVIATNHGGSSETVVPGHTGWLVPPGNPVALARAIASALALSPDERAILAERSIEHIRANFTKDLMCERTLRVYEEVLFPAEPEPGSIRRDDEFADEWA